MRIGTASIIMGSLAILLCTSAVISSTVFSHLQAQYEAQGLEHELRRQAVMIESFSSTLCLEKNCNWEKVARSYASNSVVFVNKRFESLTGHIVLSDPIKAAVQDAFFSKQSTFLDVDRTEGKGACLISPVVIQGEGELVMLLFGKGTQETEKTFSNTLLLLQIANVVLVLLFGGYMMNRTVVGPIAALKSWVNGRNARDSRIDDTAIAHPKEIAELQVAFGELLKSLDTERFNLIESQRRLSQTQQQLLHRERLVTVGRVASGIAHEVGNPLSSVIGFLSLLKKKESFESFGLSQDEILERMDGELERVRKAVRRLLDLSQPVLLNYRSVLLAELLRDVELIIRGRWQAVLFEFHWSVAKDYQIETDADVLLQVLVNLCMNAGEAMKQSGCIHLEIESKSHNQCALRISDEGPGVDPNIRELLFEAFQTTRLGEGGTGLGLAISKSLIQSVGGSLSLLESSKFGGATFEVVLSKVRKSS